MTEQNARTNVNNPRGGRLITSNTQLNLDDDLVIVDSSGGPVTLTLPAANAIPGLAIDIKALSATANNVTVVALGIETIDGNPTQTLVSDNEVLQVKSDGDNWRNVCCNAGGSGSGSLGDPVIFSPTEPPLTPVFNAGDQIQFFGIQVEEGTTSLIYGSQTASVVFSGPTLAGGVTSVNDIVSQITDNIPSNAVGPVSVFASNNSFIDLSNAGFFVFVENPVSIISISTDPIASDSGANVPFTFELSNEPFNLQTSPSLELGDLVLLNSGIISPITINSITSIVGNTVTLDIDTTGITPGVGTLRYTRTTLGIPTPVTLNFTIT